MRKACLVVVAVCQLLLSRGLRGQEKPLEDIDPLIERQQWFYGQRAYPLRMTPPGARLRALRQMKAMEAKQGRSSVIAGVGGVIPTDIGWHSIGPAPTTNHRGWGYTSGRITALAVDPTNRDIVYAGAADGGVWKTTDGGGQWVPVSDFEDSLSIGSLAIDPSNRNTVYAGTGEPNLNNDAYYGAGILKSTDAGSTWKLIQNFSYAGYADSLSFIGGIAVHPTNSQIVLAAVSMQGTNASSVSGIYRTVDGGASWTQVLGCYRPEAIVFNPLDPNLVYAAAGYIYADLTNGIYKSTDAGAHWTPSNGSPCTSLASDPDQQHPEGCQPIPVAMAGRIALAISPSHPATLYASIQSLQKDSHGHEIWNLLGVYRSSDGAAHWHRLNVPDFCVHQCWYDNVIAVNPRDPAIIVAGGRTTLLRSLDGADAWHNVISANGVKLHVDTHALAFSADGSRLYCGNDGGIWSSDDFGQPSLHWEDLNSTLAIAQFYPGFAIHPTDPRFTLGGTQDNGVQRTTGAYTWEQVVCGDGGWSAINPLHPNIVYTTCTPVNGLVWRSLSKGDYNSWLLADAGIDSGDRVGFIPPFAIDPTTPSTLYFGTYRLYQSTNGGEGFQSWLPISKDLTAATPGSYVTTIAAAQSESKTVYVGTSDAQIQVTRHALAGGLTSWINISVGLNRWVTQVVVDPYDANVAYATYSGFINAGSTFTGHVYKTSTAGLTHTPGVPAWTDISNNLPDIPVNDIVVDPDVRNRLYLATDIGVFASTNGGASWSPMNHYLPRAAVVALRLHPTSRVLRAATHGRGMWDFVVSIPPPTVALSRTEIDFGTVTSASAAHPETVTLTNTGDSTVTLVSTAISGDYEQTNTCGGHLHFDRSCTITITFHPTAAGQSNGALFLTDNALDSPQKITLKGALAPIH